MLKRQKAFDPEAAVNRQQLVKAAVENALKRSKFTNRDPERYLYVFMYLFLMNIQVPVIVFVK